jgi:CRP-like cAMP-binding protein
MELIALKPYQKLLNENPELVSDYKGILIPLSHAKNHLLHVENKVCKHSFIIEKGAARIFHFKDGKDITSHFAFEGEAITAIDSLLQGKKSKYNIELLEDSTLFSASYEDMENFYQKSIMHERFGRLFLQQVYVDLVERIEDIQFHTAQERYNNLLKKHPQILQRVPLKHISSYLGITQETLSRIRRL